MPKTSRPTARLNCEALEDRSVPSASLVADLIPGANQTGPRHVVAGGDRLWFQILSEQGGPGLYNPAVWSTDGTAADTHRLFGSTSPPGSATPFAGAVFLGGGGLYKSDGTPAGTTRVGPAAAHLAASSGKLFFAGATAGVSGGPTGGTELWASDGTAGGTALVKDIYPGGIYISRWVRGSRTPVRMWRAHSSSPAELTDLNGAVVFAATNGTSGRELWRSDGTAAGTVLVKDIVPGSGGSNPRLLTAMNGAVYFAAGSELWKTDGSAAGTVRVQSFAAVPTGLTVVDGDLFFAVNDELWTSEGTAEGTARLADIVPGAGGEPLEHLTAVGDALYFTAADPAAGRELWTSDGTAEGTARVADVGPGVAGGVPSAAAGGELAASGGRIYFTADDGLHGVELWESDGTAAGTRMVQDTHPGAAGSHPADLTDLDGVLYFAAADPVFGRELRRTPGNAAPGLVAGDATVNEGNTGTRAATFTVTLTAPATAPVTVRYATADGSATAGADYAATSGTLTFAPGETSRTVTVPVTADRVREGNETFALVLSDPTGAAVYTRQATGTIADDEPYLSVHGAAVREGRRGTSTWLAFTITLSAAYDEPVSVPFATVDGTAVAGSDYQAVSGTLTFAPGETTKTVRVKVYGDRLREQGGADEAFLLRVSDPWQGLAPVDGYGFIINDD